MDLMTTAQLLGNIGEFVGAIAVVVTLAYLAIQIRDQNREARASAVHEILDAFRQQNAILGQSDIAALYIKASSGLEHLTEVEKFQLHTINYGFNRIFEEAFYEHKVGRLDLSTWKAIDAQFKMVLGIKGIRQDWISSRDGYSDAFRTYGNTIAEQSDGVSTYYFEP